MEAAIHYAIPAEELSRVVIAYAAKKLLSIPEESLEEYEHPKEIVTAYRKAVRAGKQGKLLTSLPKSIGRALHRWSSKRCVSVISSFQSTLASSESPTPRLYSGYGIR